MKYAKYLPELQRRETWEELVTRNKEMHKRRYPGLVDDIETFYRFVYKKKVLPSMRSLQFGGKPIEIFAKQKAFNPAETFALVLIFLFGCEKTIKASA